MTLPDGCLYAGLNTRLPAPRGQWHGSPHDDGRRLSPSPGFPEQFARTRRFALGAPRNLTPSPDGSHVLFVRTGAADDPVGALWIRDGGGERLLADPRALEGEQSAPTQEEAARRERARDLTTGVTDYAVDDSAQLAAFCLGGAVWAVRTSHGEPFPVPAAGAAVDPRPSPDGRLIAYVTGGALHVVGTDGGDERRLSPPAGEEVTYGLTDYVSAESMGRTRGYWWAPDGSALLVARVDTTSVQRRWLSDPANPGRSAAAPAVPGRGLGERRGHAPHHPGRRRSGPRSRMGQGRVRVRRRRRLGRARPPDHRAEPRPADPAHTRRRSGHRSDARTARADGRALGRAAARGVPPHRLGFPGDPRRERGHPAAAGGRATW